MSACGRHFLQLLLLLAAWQPLSAAAGNLTVAVAANMKFAFAELAEDFQRANPGVKVTATYGSSGKLVAQIINGAPFDVFVSADAVYPRQLVAQQLTAGPAYPYAVGHLVLWSLKPALGKLPLNELPQAAINKFAIANPVTAPYGQRAQEALQHAGVWDALLPKIVRGESIAQTAQFIDTGAADAGIIALSLVLGPELKGKGSWSRIPDDWHQPLVQEFVILKRAAANRDAQVFATYMGSEPARVILRRYGFD